MYAVAILVYGDSLFDSLIKIQTCFCRTGKFCRLYCYKPAFSFKTTIWKAKSKIGKLEGENPYYI